MNKEELRVRIAEICGWNCVFYHKGKWMGIKPGMSTVITPPPEQIDDRWAEIPDYLNDLNAMHEAENLGITGHPFDDADYESMLQKVVGPYDMPYRATAVQRAEAFILTMELENE